MTEFQDPEEVALAIGDGLFERLGGPLWAPEQHEHFVIVQPDDLAGPGAEGEIPVWWIYARTGKREAEARINAEALATCGTGYVESYVNHIERALTGGRREATL